MSKIIILMGAPGAGKGTQARMLEERHGWPQISTGDMFRALAKSDSPLAKEVREIQASGKLISDDVVIRIVEDRTNREDCKRGYILDGFPRTIPQAEKLERLARAQGHELTAILVDVPFDILEKRLVGRRSCPVCGEIYNVYFKPPKTEGICDLPPYSKLEQREDDTKEKIKVRLETYEQQTRPLLDYYARTNRLQRVDATREPETIYAEIEKTVTSDK